MSDLLDLLAMESDEIDFRFRKASLEGKGTPQEVSDRRESVVKKFLAKYFPFPFRIAKGNIRDSHGGRSASIDCIVLSPDHPYTVSEDEQFSVILADGVDFAIEVKPDMSSKTEIERSLSQVASVKALKRIIPQRFNGGAQPEIPCVVFSSKTYENPVLLLNYISAYYKDNNIKRLNQFDILVVNNRFLLLNCRHHSYIRQYNIKVPEGFLILNSGKNTLAAMVMFLNDMPLSTLRAKASVISHYLHENDMGGLTWSDSVNATLNEIEMLP